MPLPTGLSLSRTTGALSGVPSAAGTFDFTLTVTDALGTTRNVDVALVINAYTAMALTGTLALASHNVAYSSGYTRTGGAAPFLYSISAGSLPTGITLDTGTGVLSGTPSAAGTYNFTVRVQDGPAQIATQASTIFVPVAPVISGSVIDGTVGVPYSRTFSTSNGNPGYTYSVFSGALPGGLTLSGSTGLLSGTPTTPGGFAFVIRSTDLNGQTSNTGSLTPTIVAVPALTGTAGRGSIGSAYSYTPSQSGGKSPFVYSLLSGSLPASLSLNTGTGAVTGTPSAAATSEFIIRSIDALGNISDTALQSVTIATALTLTGTLNSTLTLNVPYSSSLTASYGWTPYAFDLSVGTLPTGLSINASTGAITGTPTGSGTSNFTVRVTDADGRTATSAQSLTVQGALAWGAAYAADVTVGQAYSSASTVTGGVTPYTYSLLSGTLPTGTSLNTSSGLISGTVTAAGTYNFTIRVTDNASSTADKASTTTVAAAPLFLNAYSQYGTQTVAYNSAASMSGGRAPLAFTLQAGSLPTSLSLDAGTGAITGTPTVNGTYNFTIRATDANGATVDQVAQTIVASFPTLSGTYPRGCIGTSYSSSLTGALGHTPYTYTHVGGTMPAGLSLGSSNCLLNGTPTGTAQTYSFTIRLTDAAGNTVDSAQSVQMAAAVSFGSQTLNTITQNSAFTQTFTPTGGYTAYTWDITAGSLPAGITLAAGTGIISGTTAASGAVSFTLRATDADGNVGSKAFSGTIVVPVTVVVANKSIYAGGDGSTAACSCSLLINADGTWGYSISRPASSGTYAGEGVTVGSAADVEFRITDISGDSPSGVHGAWRNMNTKPSTLTMSAAASGSKGGVVQVEFRRASDNAALANAQVTMTADSSGL